MRKSISSFFEKIVRMIFFSFSLFQVGFFKIHPASKSLCAIDCKYIELLIARSAKVYYLILYELCQGNVTRKNEHLKV